MIAYIGPSDGNEQAVRFTDADGSGQQVSVLSDSRLADPVWSPDGQILAFHYSAADESGIRLYRPSEDTVVTLKAAIFHYDEGCCPAKLGAWSPDGRYIALDRGSGSTREIEIVDVGADEILASFTLAYYGMAFSPDSTQLAVGMVEGDEIVTGFHDPTVTIIDWATDQQQAIVEGETGKDQYRVLAWLPDGRVLYRHVRSSGGEQTASLWTITPGADAEPHQAKDVYPQYDRDAVIARIPEDLRDPYATYSFSPDGTWFAFDTKDNAAIYVMRWDTGEMSGPFASGSDPAWRPER